MDDAVKRWSDLPPELWSKVGKCFHNHIDRVRFRSVCRSWRSSSVIPSPLTSPLLSFRFPSPSTSRHRSGDAFLSLSTVYLVTPLSSSSSSRRNGRLLKLEKSENGKMRHLHPLSKHIITRYHFENLPQDCKELNLLDFRIEEVASSYSLKYNDSVCAPEIAKVVLFPKPPDAEDVRDCTAIAVWNKGKLGFARSGDRKWTRIDRENSYYDDVIVYKGQVYAVDSWGTVFWIDSTMKLVQFSPPLIGFGHRKHLVECGGELLVIDRFLEEDRPIQQAINVDGAHPLANLFRFRQLNDSPLKAVGFKTYKLDQDWGKWMELKNLENRSIVLGNDCCFSVDASEFEGCKGNCIYYSDLNDNKLSKRCSSRVFDLEEAKIGNILAYPGLIGIFNRPPIWLSTPFIP